MPRLTLFLLALVAAHAGLWHAPRPAAARMEYLNAFLARYNIPAARDAKCTICHGANKKTRSEYAIALERQLGARMVKNAAQINAALQAVEAVEARQGVTYGDLLKGGNLPPPFGNANVPPPGDPKLAPQANVINPPARNVRMTISDMFGSPVPCRIHLKDAKGEPIQLTGLPFFKDHNSFSGHVETDLPVGKYTYEIERGPEFARLVGEFEVGDKQPASVTHVLTRISDLGALGWWSGDLHVHRPVEDIELLMRAEDLHVAPVITWWNRKNLWSDREIPGQTLHQFDGNRFYDVMGGEDERGGGALLYFQLPRPIEITQAAREFPSPVTFLNEASKQSGAWIDVEKPFWWDVPTWLATGQVDSIGLANNHMCRGQMYETEAWGRPRDAERLPPPRGNGYWSQEVYYKVLNAGLRIPPSAGSASGVLPNPVGYNRVYVHTGPELTWDGWWEGLRAGRSFVTNGPLLLCTANGKLPGEVFTAKEGAALSIDLSLRLISNDPVAALEVVRNGEVNETIPVDPSKTDQELTARIEFDESGWFLVRAIADVEHTFRFASTAPYYVEIGDAPRRISRRAAQFLVDWVGERTAQIQLADPLQQAEVLQFHAAALQFWKGRLEQANAD
jgi:hypothetical protein